MPPAARRCSARAVVGHEERIVELVCFSRSDVDHFLLGRCQALEHFKVGIHRQRRTRLVEPGGVEVFADLLQAELFIGPGADPFGAVQRTRRQGLIDFASRHHLHRCAQFGNDFSAQTRHPEFQPLEIFHGLDFLTEPAATLRAGLTTDVGVQAEDFAKVAVQFTARPSRSTNTCISGAVMPKGTVVK